MIQESQYWAYTMKKTLTEKDTGTAMFVAVLFTIAMASLIAKLVKNLPAMQETWVLSPSREDPLEKQ